MEKEKEGKMIFLDPEMIQWDRRVALSYAMVVCPLTIAAGAYTHMLPIVILGAAGLVWGITSFFLARSREKKIRKVLEEVKKADKEIR